MADDSCLDFVPLYSYGDELPLLRYVAFAWYIVAPPTSFLPVSVTFCSHTLVAYVRQYNIQTVLHDHLVASPPRSLPHGLSSTFIIRLTCQQQETAAATAAGEGGGVGGK